MLEENVINEYNKAMGLEMSIFEHILAHINPDGPGLLPGGEILPDDDEFFPPGELRWAAGSLDMISGHPAAFPRDEMIEAVKNFIMGFRLISEKPSLENIKKLEEILAYPDTLPVIDNVLKNLITDTRVSHGIMYQVCRLLFFKSRRRGAVKFCTAVMGLYGLKDDLELFRVIGRHDEFTLYAAIAVMRGNEPPVDIWLDMARQVTGWGRIHLVNRLAKQNREEVNDFLLTEGCRNDLMPEYTALAIARAVDLVKVLDTGRISRKKYEGAGVILSALVDSTGSDRILEGIDSYKDGESAVRRYLQLSLTRAVTTGDLLTVYTLGRTAISETEGGLDEKLAWSGKGCEEIREMTGKIMAKPRWESQVMREADFHDRDKRWNALRAAGVLNLPVEAKIIAILDKNPLQPELWYALMQRAGESSRKEIVKTARDKLTQAAKELKEKKRASGKAKDPNDAAGGNLTIILLPNGEELNLFQECLNVILSELERFPGLGWPVVKLALRSGSTTNKHLATRLLRCWNHDLIKPAVFNEVKRLLDSEDEMLQIGAENLLSHWQ